ncbi:MAG: sugar ABC transporter permease [Proteobacteria bacterium]|nr:MAG: sugar ABC transporter permease [Pseudomonadota bacterium]
MLRFRRSAALGQTFWITVFTLLLISALSLVSDRFGSHENWYNISRNAAFIAIMTLGQTVVIISGGIDLAVGSVMGLAGVVTALSLEQGYPLELAIFLGLLAGGICGLVNGYLISHLKLSSFVVTLGMLSIARSVALVISNNRMIYEFGQAHNEFVGLGALDLFGLAMPVIVSAVLGIVVSYLLKQTVWGRHVYAVGGNQEASRLNGVMVERVKLLAYLFSSLCAGLSGVLTVAWLGSASTSLGTGYELTVIAAAVIGGASLAGGFGGAWGALIGALLVEVIRNGLLLTGVDPYWQGSFVGCCIILAVLIEGMKKWRGA